MESNDENIELTPEEKPEQEELDFEHPTFSFKPGEVHSWRQQGPYLVCKSCEIEHAQFIDMDKIMVGINPDGTPILKKR